MWRQKYEKRGFGISSTKIFGRSSTFARAHPHRANRFDCHYLELARAISGMIIGRSIVSNKLSLGYSIVRDLAVIVSGATRSTSARCVRGRVSEEHRRGSVDSTVSLWRLAGNYRSRSMILIVANYSLPRRSRSTLCFASRSSVFFFFLSFFSFFLFRPLQRAHHGTPWESFLAFLAILSRDNRPVNKFHPRMKEGIASFFIKEIFLFFPGFSNEI